MNKTLKVLLVIAVIVSAIAIGINVVGKMITGQMQNTLSKNTERFQVTRGDLLLTAIGSGKITSAEIHQVMPNGSILETKAEVGDYVEKGDVLAVFMNVLGTESEFTSDYDGVMTAVPGTMSGSLLSASTSTRFEISNPEKLLLNIQVTENDVYKVEVGQNANVYIDALNLTVRGIVSNISQTGQTTGDFSVYDVTIEFDKVNENIYLGMSGSAKIQVETKKNVLKVPVDAVIEKGDKRYLLSSAWLKHPNAPRNDYYTEVKTGLSDTDFVEITKGNVEGKEFLIVNDTSVGLPFFNNDDNTNSN